MAEIGNTYFENLLKADQQAVIAEVIQTSFFFPDRISEEDNADLMEEVLEDELKTNLHIFQKDRSPGLNGWTIELFSTSFH